MKRARHNPLIQAIDQLADAFGWPGQKVECDHLQVRFRGEQYCLFGDLKSGGAIAKHEQFEAWTDSFAHLFPDGSIMRYQEQIGTREDLEILLTTAAEEARNNPDGDGTG